MEPPFHNRIFLPFAMVIPGSEESFSPVQISTFQPVRRSMPPEVYRQLEKYITRLLLKNKLLNPVYLLQDMSIQVSPLRLGLSWTGCTKEKLNEPNTQKEEK